MFTRLMVTLTDKEYHALDFLAYKECREPRDQLRYLWRTEAERRGLLTPDEQPTEQTQEAANGMPH